MSIKSKIFCGALALTACTAQAAGPYMGASMGHFDAGQVGFGDAIMMGVVAGYTMDYSDEIAVGVEVDYLRSFDDLNTDVGSADLDTYGIYGVVRYGGDMYVKGRIGYADADADVDGVDLPTESEILIGVGAGMAITDSVGVEFQYSVADDASSGNLNILYHF